VHPQESGGIILFHIPAHQFSEKPLHQIFHYKNYAYYTLHKMKLQAFPQVAGIRLITFTGALNKLQISQPPLLILLTLSSQAYRGGGLWQRVLLWWRHPTR
jgi:hypothetical protein